MKIFQDLQLLLKLQFLVDCPVAMLDLNEKYAHGVALRQELSKHVSNLPDLQLLPDMTAGLDPLPTVGDLFG
ncbi:hypothetical protein PHET_02298 [Paragonimus heterotremus]|uniref:RPRD1A/B C-terminal domain-containing protein n=1 Tax=Paragonimus heterotremus TaxID=100268 RepID=A0A8J4WKN8_9TREM|nr:hypothetical protein PHET_02298 [Paragonimus heterotremus]